MGAWLLEWVEKAIKPPMRTPRAYETYRSVIDLHLEPVLGGIRLQALKALDLERYYAIKAGAGLAPATLAKHHHVIHGALEAAVRAQFVARNVANRAFLPARADHVAPRHDLPGCEYRDGFPAARRDRLHAGQPGDQARRLGAAAGDLAHGSHASDDRRYERLFSIGSVCGR